MIFSSFFKRNRKQINQENQEQGKAGEKRIRDQYESNGYNVKRTGKGHDLKAERKDWLTGKKETKYIEVKTGNSKLSKLQKKKRRQHGKKFVVERLKPTPFGFMPDNRESDKPKRRQKKSTWGFLGHENNFDWSNSNTRKKTRKKKSDSVWDSIGPSIWGSSLDSPKKKTRKKSSTRKKTRKKKSDSIWGSDSSSIWGSSLDSPKKKTRKKSSTRKKTRKKKSDDIWGSVNTKRKGGWI